MTPRERNVVKARQLREQGLKFREIGERMGLSTKTVHEYVTDPDKVKRQARLAKYAGRCEHCGKPTTGCNGAAAAPKQCADCIRWSDEAIIDAIQSWAREFGKPPLKEDWHTANETHPSSNMSRNRGTWNDWMIRAGFRPRRDKRPETQARIEQLIEDGWTLEAVGTMYGLSPSAIYARLKAHGTSVTGLRAT